MRRWRPKRRSRLLPADPAPVKLDFEERSLRPLEGENDPRLKDMEWLRAHPDWFRENCLKIVTKSQGLQPFRLNFSQRIIRDKVNELRAQGIPPRLIVLKSRQVGISTYTTSEFFSDCFLNPYKTSLVIADTEDHAKGLFRMTRRYNRFLPEALRFKPRHNNVREIEFPNESRIEVETEGDVISMTATGGIHYSEFAFYREPEKTFFSSMQTLPRAVETLAVIESTANGQGNLFHEMWLRAVSRAQDKSLSPIERGWTPVFIPWWKHDEYVMKPWFKPQETTQAERVLAQRFKLSMNQIAWRRYQIEHYCKGDEEQFAVWYPATWAEAFRLSGRPVFNSEWLDYYADRQPPAGGNLWDATKPSEIEWSEQHRISIIVPQREGRLRVFETYNPRHSYILFADPSEGDRKSDPSPIEVLDQMTFHQAAEWWGRAMPDTLARFAAWLGWYYGGGLINAEANNQGILFFSTLLDMGYPNIWFRTTHEEDISQTVTHKPGLWQSNKTKHAMFGTARQFVRERRGMIHSPILLTEMSNAQYEKRTTATGREGETLITKPAGGHIDACLCWAGALFTHRGSLEAPLLPLPELELESAAYKAALAAERDADHGNRIALDLTGMSAQELESLLERRRQARLKTSAALYVGAR